MDCHGVAVPCEPTSSQASPQRQQDYHHHRITTTIDHRTTYGDDLALRQRIIDTIDDAKALLAPYIQVCLAA